MYFPPFFPFSWNWVTAQLHHQTIIWFRLKICIIFTKHLYLIWNNPHVSQPTTYELVCKPAQHYRPQFGHLIPLVFTEPRAALLVIHSGNEPSGENVCVFSFLPLSAGPGPARLDGQRTAAPDWKQTERGATPVTGPDRCRARYRVAPSLGCPSVADRYHNHTSTLLSPAYWIKHPPSCPARLIRTQILEGNRGFLRSWEVMGRTRKGRSNGDRPEVLCPRMSNGLMILSLMSRRVECSVFWSSRPGLCKLWA